MPSHHNVNGEDLRKEVQAVYSEVATQPDSDFHFHTGRSLTARLGYDQAVVSDLPDHAVESFAGVANPFSATPIEPGSNVVDLGSGAGFDCLIASRLVGDNGAVIGVDMTEAMLDKAR
ncbi:MAG: methyltransferase domain-containing protein, partial [Pseudomonadota bacterium]